jgi:hypothetical protein
MVYGKAPPQKPSGQGRSGSFYSAAGLPGVRKYVSAEDRESKILLAALFGGCTSGAV